MAFDRSSADFGTANTNKTLSRVDALGTVHENMTFSMWIKLNTEISSGTYGIMNIRTNASSNFIDWIIQYEYNAGTRRLVFNRSKPGSADVKIYITTTLGTSWHHIYMKYDTATFRAGIDGAEGANTATSGVGIAGASSTVFGGDGTNFLSGLLDDIRVWDTHKTDAFVWAEYTSPSELVGNETNLRAYYTFNSNLTSDLTANAYTLTNNNSVVSSFVITVTESVTMTESDTNTITDSFSDSITLTESNTNTVSLGITNENKSAVASVTNENKNG